jgi:hypothetical protein
MSGNGIVLIFLVFLLLDPLPSASVLHASVSLVSKLSEELQIIGLPTSRPLPIQGNTAEADRSL